MIPTWPVSQGFLRIEGAGEMDALGALQAGGNGVISASGIFYKHLHPWTRCACLTKTTHTQTLPVTKDSADEEWGGSEGCGRRDRRGLDSDREHIAAFKTTHSPSAAYALQEKTGAL